MLIWATLDLGVPGFCSEGQVASDSHGSPPAIATFEGPCSHPPSELASIESSESAAPEQAGEDDCWCCCSHITPASVAAPVVLAVHWPEELFFAERAPQDWTPLLYHPPRS